MLSSISGLLRHETEPMSSSQQFPALNPAALSAASSEQGAALNFESSALLFGSSVAQYGLPPPVVPALQSVPVALEPQPPVSALKCSTLARLTVDIQDLLHPAVDLCSDKVNVGVQHAFLGVFKVLAGRLVNKLQLRDPIPDLLKMVDVLVLPDDYEKGLALVSVEPDGSVVYRCTYCADVLPREVAFQTPKLREHFYSGRCMKKPCREAVREPERMAVYRVISKSHAANSAKKSSRARERAAKRPSSSDDTEVYPERKLARFE